MAEKRDLTPAEFEVMDILWKKGRATIREVHAELYKERQLAYTTISTMLNRIKDKGFVDAKVKDFAYVFTPLVQRDQVVQRKLDDLVRHILGGNIGPLAAYIAEKTNLTQKQLETLDEIVKSEPKDE